MIPLGSSTAPSPQQLVVKYRQHFANLLKTHVQRGSSGQDQEERTWLYNEALLNHLYAKNQQYAYFDGAASTFSPAASVVAQAQEKLNNYNALMSDYVLPMFQGDLEKLVSVLGTRAPNAIAAALVKGNQDQMVRARTLNKVISYLRAAQQVDQLQQQLVHILCLSGTAFGRVEYVQSPKYGSMATPTTTMRSIPAFDPYYQCPRCGAETDQAQSQSLQAMTSGPACSVCGEPLGPESLNEAADAMEWPEVSGISSSPRGSTEFTLYSMFLVDVPMSARHDENLDYLKCERYMSIADILELHPDYIDPNGRSLRDLLMPYIMGWGGGSRSPATETAGSTGADADIRSQSPSGMGFRSVPIGSRRYTEVWFPPKIYQVIPYDHSGELRDILTQQFPNGMKLAYVDALPVSIKQEVLHKKWTSCRATLSDYVVSPAIMSGYRQAMDVVNDFVNICVSAGEHSIAQVVVDGELFSPGYLKKFPAEHGQWLEAIAGTGRRISDMIDHIPGAQISEYMIKFLEIFVTLARETIGITPALYGGGTKEETARGREIQRNQALQQHNLRWNNCKLFWKRMYSNGATCIAENTKGSLITLANGQITEEMVPGVEELLKGGWDITMEESIPLTPGMQRDWLLDLLQNPQGYAIMSLIDPETGDIVPQNLQTVSQMIGIPGWYVRHLDAFEGLMENIYLLSQDQPMEQIGMDGLPFLDSSLPADPMIYPPPFAIQVIRGWLQSKEGRDLARVNPLGWKNVKAYLAGYMMEMQKALAPPPGEGEAEGEAEETGGEGGAGGGGSSGSPEQLNAPAPGTLAPSSPGQLPAPAPA